MYTDLPADELKQAVQRADRRRSATELMQPKKKPRRRGYDGLKRLLAKARDRLKELQAAVTGATKKIFTQK